MGTIFQALWCGLWERLERRRQRLALAAHLDDRRLMDDLGIEADRARAEIAKPFWRL